MRSQAHLFRSSFKILPLTHLFFRLFLEQFGTLFSRNNVSYKADRSIVPNSKQSWLDPQFQYRYSEKRKDYYDERRYREGKMEADPRENRRNGGVNLPTMTWI